LKAFLDLFIDVINTSAPNLFPLIFLWRNKKCNVWRALISKFQTTKSIDIKWKISIAWHLLDDQKHLATNYDELTYQEQLASIDIENCFDQSFEDLWRKVPGRISDDVGFSQAYCNGMKYAIKLASEEKASMELKQFYEKIRETKKQDRVKAVQEINTCLRTSTRDKLDVAKRTQIIEALHRWPKEVDNGNRHRTLVRDLKVTVIMYLKKLSFRCM
jgi:hypothetical protein